MSKRVFDPVPGAPAMTKSEKREAAKIARAKQAVAEQRRNLAKNVAIGVVVLGVLVGLYLWIKDSSTVPAASPEATPSATAPASFPPVPAGANEGLKTKPVVEKPTGTVTALKTTTLIEGTGKAAVNGSKITVNYVGVSFKDGTEFDSSWKRSQAYDLILGQGSVIKGWDEGLMGVKGGSRVQIDIPADKGYGENPTGGQPGGALRFVIDVLSVV
jgi:peptidylprolyl isomerase